MDLDDYIAQKRIAFTSIPSDIDERWNARIRIKELHKLGEAGAITYLLQYGKGISEQKCINFARKAEIEGYPEMALGFGRKAYTIAQEGNSKIKRPQKIKVLFLAANPTDTTRLRLDKEIRSIDLALQQSEYGKKFDLKQHWAVRVTDLQGYLLRHKPNVVHFSGHGNTENEIVLEDDTGHSSTVSVHALGQLFSLLKDNIRCVILNACYSKLQAEAIAEHVDCVVGMSYTIGDTAAISFSMAFYQAIGYGKDIRTAFELGCLQIDLENLSGQNVPVLLATKSNPSEVRLL